VIYYVSQYWSSCFSYKGKLMLCCYLLVSQLSLSLPCHGLGISNECRRDDNEM